MHHCLTFPGWWTPTPHIPLHTLVTGSCAPSLPWFYPHFPGSQTHSPRPHSFQHRRGGQHWTSPQPSYLVYHLIRKHLPGTQALCPKLIAAISDFKVTTSPPSRPLALPQPDHLHYPPGLSKPCTLLASPYPQSSDGLHPMQWISVSTLLCTPCSGQNLHSPPYLSQQQVLAALVSSASQSHLSAPSPPPLPKRGHHHLPHGLPSSCPGPPSPFSSWQ
jgi:hypothetical protein